VKINNVPNLDDHSVSPDDYQSLKEEFRALAQTCRTLASHCEAKQMAMYLRKKGDINRASGVERKMDDYYKSLPEWAKW